MSGYPSRVVLYLSILLVLLAFGCVSGGEKAGAETKVLGEAEIDCILCQTRDTVIKFDIKLDEAYEFNDVWLDVKYEDKQVISSYRCYPSEQEIESFREDILKGRTTNEDFWRSKLIKSTKLTCEFKSDELVKPGTYKFSIHFGRSGYKEPEEIGIVTSEVSLVESDLPPKILENKTIYFLGDVILQKPMKNQFVYRVEYSNKIEVKECEGNPAYYRTECSSSCSNQYYQSHGGIPSEDDAEYMRCIENCVSSKERSCVRKTMEAPENKKFVIVHYGIAINQQELNSKGVSCPVSKEDRGDRILSSLFEAGYCALPLTIKAAQTGIESISRFLEQTSGMLETLALLSLGIIGGTDYEIVLLDSWDVQHRQYLPKYDGNKTLIYDATTTGYAPYIFAIDESEEAKYLVAQSVTSGLVGFLVPVKKTRVFFGIHLTPVKK